MRPLARRPAHARLQLEPLEPREVPAVVTVTSLADDTTADGLVTLREALIAAETDTSVDGSAAGSGADTVVFAAHLSGAVDLTVVGDTSAGPAAFAVTTAVTVRGNDAGISVRRASGGPAMRLFNVSATGHLTVQSLTLAGGRAAGDGGAVSTAGTLTLVQSTLTGHRAVGGNGGAVANAGGTVVVVGSTLAGNAADGAGGGVFSRNGLTVVLQSTLSANTAAVGRGVYLLGDGGMAAYLLNNSIVGGADTAATDLAGGGAVSGGGTNNVVRSWWGVTGLTNTITADPQLGPLADNGGPTPTMALTPASPAFDAGDPAAAAGLGTDQRGGRFARTQFARPDVGAFEAARPPAVLSVARAGVSPTAAAGVLFTVTFDTPVTGVDAGDFALATTGLTGAAVTSVSGEGTTYAVSVSTGSGDGTVRLDVRGAAGGIADPNGTPTAADFTAGEVFVVSRPPAPPVVPPAPPPVVVTATAGVGPNGPQVRLTDPATGRVTRTLDPFPGFSGGVTVATGDLNQDGVADVVVGAKAGGGPHVKAFDGRTGGEIASFFAYAPGFSGGVSVAVGDLNGDGVGEIVTGAGPGGGPHVRAFDSSGRELFGLFAYAPGFTGGVNVATGDLDGDGRDEVVTGTASGAPHVRAFDGRTGGEVAGFYADSPTFTGGVSVAAGDLNGDGRDEIVTGTGRGGGPLVRGFDPAGTELFRFDAFDPTFTGGVNVATTDLDGDWCDDIVTGAGAGGGPHVRAWSGRTLGELASLYAAAPTFRGGVLVG